jgi:hypothetical protein
MSPSARSLGSAGVYCAESIGNTPGDFFPISKVMLREQAAGGSHREQQDTPKRGCLCCGDEGSIN